MKRLEIIVEGPSEREFVSQIVAPYLAQRGVIEAYNVVPVVLRTSDNYRGGMTKYKHLKDDIVSALSSKNPQLIVTMMVDFFRLPSGVPYPQNIDTLPSDEVRAEAIEKCIGEDVNDVRFIPYIQVHEFEALLFTSRNGFDYCYGEADKRCKSLYDIIDQYPNPEDINSSPAGAPSKRMIAIIPEYNKVIDGNIIILQNGMMSILEKCPKFSRWIENLITRLGQ